MAFPSIYPLPAKLIAPGALARDLFPAGRPEGVTVHYGATRDLDSMLRSDALDGFCYHLVIDRAGLVYQTCFLSHATWHAGNAEWPPRKPGKRGLSPNKHHAAVCLLSWGLLEQAPSGLLRSWAKTPVDASEAAQRPDNLTRKLCWWDVAPPAQETALEQVLLWFMANGISSDAICGHDEAALPLGRKDDPGGVLSCSMADLRQRLKAKTMNGKGAPA